MADSFVEAVNNKATGGNAIVPEAMDLLKTFESFKPWNAYRGLWIYEERYS